MSDWNIPGFEKTEEPGRVVFTQVKKVYAGTWIHDKVTKAIPALKDCKGCGKRAETLDDAHKAIEDWFNATRRQGRSSGSSSTEKEAGAKPAE